MDEIDFPTTRDTLVSSPGTQLPWLLETSAKWHARRAVELYTSDDEDEKLSAAVSVGTAVELFAKSYLASIEPTLIAPDATRDTLLHLTGKGGLARTPLTAINPKSAMQAMEVAKTFLPTLRFQAKSPDDQLVFRVRNAALHASFVSSEELKEAIVVMLRVIRDLTYERTDIYWDFLWGDYQRNLVNQILERRRRGRRILWMPRWASRARGYSR